MNVAVDLSFDLRDATVTLIGRVERVTRRRLAGALQARNASVTRRLTRQSNVVALGHGAVALMQSGRLSEILAQADRRGLLLLSEHGLLRRLNLLPDIPLEPRSHDLRQLASWSTLPTTTARLLPLLDIIEDADGRYSFRDLKAARDFARRLDHRVNLASALETALETRRRHGFRRHLAEIVLSGEDADQASLDLGDDAESFDAVWEKALDSEAAHDYASSEAAYRRCVSMRPRDAVCLFHLADVVAEQERPDEARDLLTRALALKPDFAEAWFNLALLESDARARQCLARAIEADPDCIEAVHELALLHMQDNDHAAALPLWERYLSLAATSTSAYADRRSVDKARRALTLCRMALLGAGARKKPKRT